MQEFRTIVSEVASFVVNPVHEDWRLMLKIKEIYLSKLCGNLHIVLRLRDLL